jgi:hypothetical protein
MIDPPIASRTAAAILRAAHDEQIGAGDSFGLLKRVVLGAIVDHDYLRRAQRLRASRGDGLLNRVTRVVRGNHDRYGFE